MAKHIVPQTDAEYEKDRRRARKAAARAPRPGAERSQEEPRRVSRRERERADRLEVGE